MSVQQERRDTTTQRIPFEAIVDIGGQPDQAAAFEAQGVDLSAGGMHLRTAYVPEKGQPLVCRFDGAGADITAEAEVVWCHQQERGGEFGIRFTNLDDAAAVALCGVCGVDRETGEPSDGAPMDVPTGTRVRLHIDGLGSPMKARVRGATESELLVGSNLEFLRVGRTIDLEDVDHGCRRPAHIDRVDIEVDRDTRVPQLVVTLCYDDVPIGDGAPAALAFKEARSFDADLGAPATKPAALAMSDGDVESARFMKSRFANAASDIMPAVASLVPAVARLGARAKTTMALLWSKAMSKRLKNANADDAEPRRTTAPAPSGVLHASGKHVVREGLDDDDTPDFTPPRRKLGRPALIALGAAGGLGVVLALVALRKPATPPPGATAPSDAKTTAALVATPADNPGSGAIQAPVPLFGPTTLSTTEPVAPSPLAAPQPAPAEVAAPAVVTADPGSFVAPAADDGQDSKTDGDENGKSRSEKSRTKAGSFVNGKVVHPVALRLRTDGEITALHGARSATGFTVSIPGRRALDSGSSLASRDPRIASVHVSNGSKGSEVTFRFKDFVPAYAVRARGQDLRILLGRADKADGATTTHPTTAKTHKSAKRTHRSATKG
jgi:hypothetical protein